MLADGCADAVMDGYQAARLIRKNPLFDDIPIIAMTANAMEQDIQYSHEAGMVAHVAKPVDPSSCIVRSPKSLSLTKRPFVPGVSIDYKQVLSKRGSFPIACLVSISTKGYSIWR